MATEAEQSFATDIKPVVDRISSGDIPAARELFNEIIVPTYGHVIAQKDYTKATVFFYELDDFLNASHQFHSASDDPRYLLSFYEEFLEDMDE